MLFCTMTAFKLKHGRAMQERVGDKPVQIALAMLCGFESVGAKPFNVTLTNGRGHGLSRDQYPPGLQPVISILFHSIEIISYRLAHSWPRS
jgi:hypothetical protein